MNEFEKKMKALRLQFKAEQRAITKDANRTICRLNTAINRVDCQEAREALRAERARVLARMRQSHEDNRTCYLQQLEMINEEMLTHFTENPSLRHLRRMMARLCQYAESKGQDSLTVYFDDNRRGELKII